jgi:predicted DsbA family dithiol-disulfide isomerase
MQIEIILDTICPWCYIGLNRLTKALLERPKIKPIISYKPFILDPEIPIEGMKKLDYISEKFRSEKHYNDITKIMNDIGINEKINLNLDIIKVIPNSLDSHCLIMLAETIGKDHDVLKDIMKYYFSDGINISKRNILFKIGEKYQLDKKNILEYLDNEKYKKSLFKETMRLRHLGVTGVPTYIINNSFAISGAQDQVALLKVIDLANNPKNSVTNLQSYI